MCSGEKPLFPEAPVVLYIVNLHSFTDISVAQRCCLCLKLQDVTFHSLQELFQRVQSNDQSIISFMLLIRRQNHTCPCELVMFFSSDGSKLNCFYVSVSVLAN
jgi:hypothetical protein